MTDTVFCRHCGEPLAADSKFCEHCGTEQEPREEPKIVLPANIVPRQINDARDRVEEIVPGAGELVSQLTTQLRAPVVATALISGMLAAAGMFAVALIFGLVLSDQSLIGLVDQGKGAITAAFAQMVNFLQVGYGEDVGKVGPFLFVVFPIGSCAIAAATQARRTLGLAPLVRLASGAGVGLVFGLLMLIPALGAGGLDGAQSIEPDVLAAVVLGAVWGALGGLLGTYYVMRTALPSGFLVRLVPAQAREVARTAFLALRPLALLLVLTTTLGTVSWTVETLRESDLRQGSSTPVAVIDDVAYSVEHGVHWTELSGLAQFRIVGEGAGVNGVPVPIGDVSKLKVDGTGRYRLFGFSHAMPTYTFVPLTIFLLASALLMAFGAGAAVAQARLPQTPWAAAAWGCLVGPIWALAMVILNALLARSFFGRADGASVFGSFLLGGLVVGAVGGLVSVQSQRRQTMPADVGLGVVAQAKTGSSGGAMSDVSEAP
jgi:zinc-ribbon domain